MEYEGFNVSDASVLYISPPMDRASCEVVELIWPVPFNRPFTNYRGSRYEVIDGDYKELSKSFDKFIESFLPESYIHNKISLVHFFEFRGATMLFPIESNRQAVEVAKIQKYWADAKLIFSCFGSFRSSPFLWYLNMLYIGEKGLPKQSHTLYLDSIENVLFCLARLSMDESVKALNDWDKSRLVEPPSESFELEEFTFL